MCSKQKLVFIVWAIFWHITTAITMCDSDNTGSPAGYWGSITSPSFIGTTYLDCKVLLTGIPKYSWVGVYPQSLNLLSDCLWGLNDYNYIRVGGSRDRICNETRGPIYHFQRSNASLKVEFYSTNPQPQHHFTLLYFVAKVIDIPRAPRRRILDLTSEDNGYIVSHHDYGNNKYRHSIGSELTLTNLSSNYIELKFVFLDLELDNCDDSLVITTNSEETKICGGVNYRGKYLHKSVLFQTTRYQISFKFETDGYVQNKGFRFIYRVIPPNSTTAKPTVSEKTTSKTKHSPMPPTDTPNPFFSTISELTKSTAEFTEATSMGGGLSNNSSKPSSENASVIILPSSPAEAAAGNDPRTNLPARLNRDEQDNANRSSRNINIYIGAGVTSCVVLVIAVIVTLGTLKRKRSSVKASGSPKPELFPQSDTQAIALAVITASSKQIFAILSTCWDSAAHQTYSAAHQTYSAAHQAYSAAHQAYSAAHQTYGKADGESEHPKYSYTESGVHSTPAKENIYSLADETEGQQQLSQPTNQDNVYYLAEPMTGDVYENMDTVQRVENENEMAEGYAAIVAHTKRKGNVEVTEFVHNDLYGT